MTAHIRYIDLFAGIGGISQALHRVFPSSECVMVSEKDKFSLQTYQANNALDSSVYFGDITKVDENSVPAHDILLGGFPCQAFSISGKKLGFEDTRGTLFFDIARIAKCKRPKVLLLENVKNLESHDKGNTFKVILKTLEDIGYHATFQKIVAKHFVPQKRERIYIVAVRNDLPTFDFSKVGIPAEIHILKEILFSQTASNISGNPNVDKFLNEEGFPLSKYTISDQLWAFLKSHADKHASKGNGFGYGLHTANDVARTLTARYYKDGSEILIAQEGLNPRKLTPRECARLMGFDDSFIIPVSDSQAYKQFGNSVVVPVLEAILSEIKNQCFK